KLNNSSELDNSNISDNSNELEDELEIINLCDDNNEEGQR
ncbi:5701_t:CDS:1, partial [Dentiscutata heterogama]